jgi:hypothetical protein
MFDFVWQHLGLVLFGALVLLIVSMFATASFLDYIREKAYGKWLLTDKKQPFWGCNYFLHPWQMLKREPTIPVGFEMPPALVMGMHIRLRQQFGEQDIRYCPCCEVIQELQYDYSGCLSITDPPSSSWVEIKKESKSDSKSV